MLYKIYLLIMLKYLSQVDDSCLQLYRPSEEGGTYLDLDSSIEQQRDEFSAFQRLDQN